MKISLGHAISFNGDETANYAPKIIEGGTVKDFIDMILSSQKEWGYIGIKSPRKLFGYPNIEYSYGKIVSVDGDIDLFNEQEVKSIKASGGWTRMDYILNL